MSKIRNYSINGLFGFHNFSMPLDSHVKIVIGENGLGKTTILNSLYYLLTKKWNKLIKIDFISLELEFIDYSRISFTKNDLENYLFEEKSQKKRSYSNFFKEIQNFINIEELKHLINNSTDEKNYNTQDLIYEYIVRNKINKKTGAPVGYIVETITRFLMDGSLSLFNEIIALLDRQLDTSILYFPTYRRVEEELKNLGHIKRIQNDEFNRYGYMNEEITEETREIQELEDETLIQFGMGDVDRRIKRVLSEINESSITGFSKVTADILSQMLRGFPIVTEETLEKLNRADIEIILNRVRDNLSEVDRTNILGIVESKKLAEKPDLVFFLNNLLNEIYYKQKNLDDNIKKFVSVCNKYLVEKSIIFNESTVTIEIRRKISNQNVSFNQLSSGEKQIVSLFSKIYLEKSDKLIVLFDEPELSLSIYWQRQLLPDIVNSGKCDMLLAVTHSPFIFDNELSDYAIGMNIFID